MTYYIRVISSRAPAMLLNLTVARSIQRSGSKLEILWCSADGGSWSQPTTQLRFESDDKAEAAFQELSQALQAAPMCETAVQVLE